MGINGLLSELRRTEDLEDGTEWFMSMGGGERTPVSSKRKPPLPISTLFYKLSPSKRRMMTMMHNWAAYDRTPSQTPHQKRSPAPMTSGGTQIGPNQSELEYFARYGSVQPALDAHDPDEESSALQQSTLDGNALSYDCEPSIPSI